MVRTTAVRETLCPTTAFSNDRNSSNVEHACSVCCDMSHWRYRASILMLLKWPANLTQCDFGALTKSMQHLLVCPLCPNTCTRESLNVATGSAVKLATYYLKSIWSWNKWKWPAGQFLLYISESLRRAFIIPILRSFTGLFDRSVHFILMHIVHAFTCHLLHEALWSSFLIRSSKKYINAVCFYGSRNLQLGAFKVKVKRHLPNKRVSSSTTSSRLWPGFQIHQLQICMWYKVMNSS